MILLNKNPNSFGEQLERDRCTSNPRRMGRMATLLLDNFEAEESLSTKERKEASQNDWIQDRDPLFEADYGR
jgi:hypothetical protein